MATKADNPLDVEGDPLTLDQVLDIWSKEVADREVYEAVVDARLHALTVAQIADHLGVTRQHVHKQWWQPFNDAEPAGTTWDVTIPDGFDPETDVPVKLADVVQRRAAASVTSSEVFRAIVQHRIETGASIAQVAEYLDRKREQVYRDYWTKWATYGGQAIAAAAPNVES